MTERKVSKISAYVNHFAAQQNKKTSPGLGYSQYVPENAPSAVQDAVRKTMQDSAKKMTGGSYQSFGNNCIEPGQQPA